MMLIVIEVNCMPMYWSDGRGWTFDKGYATVYNDISVKEGMTRAKAAVPAGVETINLEFLKEYK